MPREILRRGTMGWGMSLAIGVAFGVGLESAGVDVTWWLLAVALATTALGTLVPILSDARLFPTPIGQRGPRYGRGGRILADHLHLGLPDERLRRAHRGPVARRVRRSGRSSLPTLALRTRPPRVLRIVQDTLHTTGQVGRPRLDLRPRAAGVRRGGRGVRVRARRLRGRRPRGSRLGLLPRERSSAMRLEGIGFGFLVPVYFVVTG